jgi:hypothetical protein
VILRVSNSLSKSSWPGGRERAELILMNVWDGSHRRFRRRRPMRIFGPNSRNTNKYEKCCADGCSASKVE